MFWKAFLVKLLHLTLGQENLAETSPLVVEPMIDIVLLLGKVYYNDLEEPLKQKFPKHNGSKCVLLISTPPAVREEILSLFGRSIKFWYNKLWWAQIWNRTKVFKSYKELIKQVQIAHILCILRPRHESFMLRFNILVNYGRNGGN